MEFILKCVKKKEEDGDYIKICGEEGVLWVYLCDVYEEGIVVFKEKKMKYYVICVKKEKVVVYRQIGY